jgi:hypothetical protein
MYIDKNFLLLKVLLNIKIKKRLFSEFGKKNTRETLKH